MARARVGCRSAHGGAQGNGWPGAGARQASVERYLIGVRPVLINVFVDDLVEILAPWRAEPVARKALRG
ncbi:hypothetical protein D5R55_24855 [Burkholderia cenocepacia]|uniref:Uncharacterized protein n=1 Tax=Burkholderia cenocepacia TaxID=95486 RepID=A0A3S9NF12_9BURK|nr:hypothetical protein D5R55_24855 [Burkholderia cenocepacia]